MTAADLLPLIVSLQAEVEALKARLDPQPVRSWRGAAAVLRVSEDTVLRRRQEAGDTSRPRWSSPDAVREWWAEIEEAARPPAPPKPKPKPAKPRRADGPLDVQALMDEVSGRKPARR